MGSVLPGSNPHCLLAADRSGWALAAAATFGELAVFALGPAAGQSRAHAGQAAAGEGHVAAVTLRDWAGSAPGTAASLVLSLAWLGEWLWLSGWRHSPHLVLC